LIAFETTEFSFTARLIDGTFPSYQTIIPPVAPNSVTCDRGHLLVALSRLSAAAANIGIGLVGMRWGHGSGLDLFLARQPLDGADKIEAEVSGNAEVVLSLPQFASMLAEFCCERIRLETADGQPVVIRGEREKLGLIARCTWNFRRDEARDAELQRT